MKQMDRRLLVLMRLRDETPLRASDLAEECGCSVRTIYRDIDALCPALFTQLGKGQYAPTLEMKVSFLRAAQPGLLIGKGRVAHLGRSVAFLEGTLMTEDGTVVAIASATARVLAGNGRSGEEGVKG